MSQSKRRVTIVSSDGHIFAAWRSDPTVAAKGGVVVLHAVYGLTDHIGDVCAHWADAGYCAVAPALFDRIGTDLVYPYDRAGVNSGAANYAKLTEAGIFADIEAAKASLADAGPVAISGFCTGGTWAWRAAAALRFTAHVNFYGSHVPAFVALTQRCPTLMHYGDADTIVPLAAVENIRAMHPDIQVDIYPGGSHAFLNPEQASYDAAAATLAWQRSILFLDRQFAGR